MSDVPNRDPVGLVLQALTLAVLIWIAIGISNLATSAGSIEVAPDHSAELQQTLAALDRAMEVLTHSPARNSTGTSSPTAPNGSDGGKSKAADVAGAGEPAELRSELPRPMSVALRPDIGESLFDLSERVTAKSAVAALRDLHNRLRAQGDDVRRRTQRGFILMDRATVVRRFGRPTSIGESRNGASEEWTYRVEDVSVTLTIRGDYVIRIS